MNDARPSYNGLVPAASVVSLRSEESRAPYGALGDPCLRRLLFSLMLDERGILAPFGRSGYPRFARWDR